MRHYDSFGPNPRALRMFMHEKRMALPKVEIDLMGGENRRGEYLERNPGGQVPALERDDGQLLAETAAIFEYLEELQPTPPLIGTNPEERADTRMWQRRIELKITENLYNGFRFAEGIDLFRDRLRVIPEAADGLKATVRDNLAWLDRQLTGRPFIAGDRFTVADIILYCGLEFGAGVGQPIDPRLKNVLAWRERVAARPSARASLHPQADAVGMAG